jgi:hypothetical protein
MKISILDNQLYSNQMKVFFKWSQTFPYILSKIKLKKKVLKVLHLTWFIMWFNMHMNLLHNVFNESSYFEPCILIYAMTFLMSHHILTMHINVCHNFHN